MLLSVCLITKNEEQHIERCLSSVKDIADEIIIVDSYSTDQTILLAKKFGSSIFFYQWKDDYAHARNLCIAHAKGNWILFLDADEVLFNPSVLRNQLSRLPETSSIQGFLIERTDIYREMHTRKLEKYPIGIVRLFKNEPHIKYENPVHEIVHPSIVRSGHPISVMRNTKILHFVHLTSLERLEQKQRYYLSLINKELEKNPQNYWMKFQKAKTLWFLKKETDALELFQKTSADILCPLDISVASLCNIGALNLKLNKYDEAIHALEQSLRLLPSQFQAYFLLGDVHYKMGRFIAALTYYSKVPTTLKLINWNNYTPGGLFLYSEVKLYKIACCFLALNQFWKAKLFFLFSSVLNRKYADPFYALGLHYSNTDAGKAAHYFKKCIERDPEWIQPRDHLQIITDSFNKKTPS